MREDFRDTLFYIELILFEEAAIHMADREIINLARMLWTRLRKIWQSME